MLHKVLNLRIKILNILFYAQKFPRNLTIFAYKKHSANDRLLKTHNCPLGLIKQLLWLEFAFAASSQTLPFVLVTGAMNFGSLILMARFIVTDCYADPLNKQIYNFCELEAI